MHGGPLSPYGQLEDIGCLFPTASQIQPADVETASQICYVQALGRNPAAAPKILISMILAFLFAEGIAVFGLLIVYNLFGG